jgi:hypothetical protein
MKGMIRTTNISVSLPGEMQEKLRQAAKDDNRSVSSLVTALVDAYLIREGYKYPGRERIAPRPVARQARLEFDY